MKLKLFTLSFSKSRGGFDDTPLREFLEGKEVISIQQNAFLFEGLPYWAVLVSYTGHDEKGPSKTRSLPVTEEKRPPQPAPDPAPAQKTVGAQNDPTQRPVYTPVGLSKKEMALYETLRRWRNEKSKVLGGIPLYAICNNRELEAIARTNPPDLQALKSLKGLRSAFVVKYGDDLMRAVRNGFAQAGRNGVSG